MIDNPKQANSAQAVKLLDLIAMAAAENAGTLSVLTTDLERFADRMEGAPPSPLKTGNDIVGRLPDPPMIGRLQAANDDMTAALARLGVVVSRITSLA